MSFVLRSLLSRPAWAGRRLLRSLLTQSVVFSVAVGLSACGHLGIDLGDGSTSDGLAGASHSSGGSNQTGPDSGGASSTGGKDTGSGGGGGGTDSGGTDSGGTGGDATGGTAGSGGADTGGQGGDGGTSSGGTSSGGASSGGAGSGGTAATGGSGGGGTGGATFDCDTTDPLCAVLLGAQAHRYSFDGMGTAVPDPVGGEAATLVGTTLDGSGEVDLSGLNDYVSLPGGLLAALPNATIEVWFVWNGGESWQRLFEFGNEDALGDPTSYLYATPQAGGTILPEIALGAGIRHQTGGDRQLRTLEVTQTGVLTHVVLVADDVGNRLSIYKNGTWVAQRDTPVDLNGIQDQTNQLGRSLFDDDPNFDGTITELRIYGAALSAAAIAKSYAVGPDATFGP